MRIRYLGAAVAAATLVFAAPSAAATVRPFTGSGDNAAALGPTLDGFRTALGSARREIHWGDVPTADADPLPQAYYADRGTILSTPGGGFRVSFGSLRPIGATITDVSFRLPGAETPATVAGFGATFRNVSAGDGARIELFGADGAALGSVAAPAGSFSFAGATVAGDAIARVRITGAALDDFLYAEPQAASVFSLGQAAYAVHEQDRSLAVTVRRAGVAAPGSVRLTTANGTAYAGRDYKPVDEVVAFAAGQAAKTVAVPVLRDRAREPDQTFTLTLGSAQGGVVGAPASATVTIHDDPPALDRTRPTVEMLGVKRTMRRARFLRGVKLRVYTDEAASLDGRLLAAARTAIVSRRVFNLELAHARFAAARGTRTIVLKPRRSLVGRARKLTVRLRIVAIDRAGNRSTARRTIRVR
jgi:Calx-beta domain